ncbi:rhodanese-like domain-containing protein [Salinisphaera sp. LB1]|uniref:rhodanese-like domain-containing protein n=1 Tax=Salinisphaera sp. LB1 TaxID=2183911 RepID=UPI000D70726A|nr:rhodanese-like domain-containing protein [Salinisphaera sp. LB1]AWN15889.1 Rhodanese-related sulfurtransferase [Salinisphaera sp. LB1]
MNQLLEFVVHHPFLWAALGVIVIAFIANEVWRALSGSGPISSGEAVRLMNSDDAVVVDTRSSSEYKKHHILNAKHVPAAGIAERAKEISRDPNKPIIVYCGAGNAAPAAAAKLRAKGYTRVYALKGGINGWRADGLPVTSK